MIELVIKYDPDKKLFMGYEPTTSTLITSASLTEALVNIERFLEDSKLIKGSILDCTDISYHIDSYTMKSMVESNTALLKRLNTAPSGFNLAQKRFGTTSTSGDYKTRGDRGGSSSSSTSTFGKGSRFSNSHFANTIRKWRT